MGWRGCQPGVMVLTDLYGKLTLSGVSLGDTYGWGPCCCPVGLLVLTSATGGVYSEVTPLNMGGA